MINISNSLKQACNSDKITYREYVVLKGTTTQIDVMTEMYATAYKDTHFIGTFNMKYIKFTTTNDVQYRNKELTLYKEINGESFKVGNFIVTEIKDDDSNEEVTVTAYDYGLKFAQTYQTNLNYASNSITLYQVLQEVCNKCGVTLKNENITNGDFIVDSYQFTDGQLYGDVVSAVAFISGNFATINNNNELELIFNTATDEIIEDYVDLEDKRDTQPITSVSIGLSNIEGENVVLKDQNLIDEYGEHWLIINDVPFAYNQSKREQLITAIFNKVKGFGYSAFKSEYAFKPYYSLGDLVQFRNKEGQLVNSIILRITSKYDNVILEAPSITKAAVQYQNPMSALEIAKRTEIDVDKQNQEIQALASQVVPVSNTIKGVRQIQLENAYEGRLHYLSIKGNISLLYPSSKEDLYGYALAPSETLMPSATLTPSTPVYKDNKILYPSNDLFSKSSVLLIDDVEYKLDFNFLNYINDTDCDEFIYEDGKCKIIRRVGVDSDGNLYATGKEVIENKKDIELNIKHNSTIKLKSFDETILETTYLLQNEYTDNFVTSVDVVSRINLSPGTAQIEASKLAQITADKINLEGYTTINGGFSVDEEGNMTANNGKFNGGQITLYNTNAESTQEKYAKLKILTSDNEDLYTTISSYFFGIKNDDSHISIYSNAVSVYDDANNTRSSIHPDYIYLDGGTYSASRWQIDNEKSYMFMHDRYSKANINCGTDPYFQIDNNTSFSSMTPNGVWSPSFNNNSLESKKKNIDFDNGCLEEILNTDICSFNWKYEDNTDQKHIGCIIADEGGNYKVSQKVLTHDKDAIDLYSMSGMSWKAIQELYNIVIEQQKKIKELEEKLDGVIETNKTK